MYQHQGSNKITSMVFQLPDHTHQTEKPVLPAFTTKMQCNAKNNKNFSNQCIQFKSQEDGTPKPQLNHHKNKAQNFLGK